MFLGISSRELVCINLSWWEELFLSNYQARGNNENSPRRHKEATLKRAISCKQVESDNKCRYFINVSKEIYPKCIPQSRWGRKKVDDKQVYTRAGRRQHRKQNNLNWETKDNTSRPAISVSTTRGEINQLKRCWGVQDNETQVETICNQGSRKFQGSAGSLWHQCLKATEAAGVHGAGCVCTGRCNMEIWKKCPSSSNTGHWVYQSLFLSFAI